MTRILLVQDIMARYRVDIFEELTAAMAALGYQLTIATGRFGESARVNHQLIIEKQWSSMHHVEVPGRTVGPLRILNLSQQLAQADAVIVTAALASNSWWSTAIRRAVRQRNLIMLMMGHGRDLNSREHGRRLSDLAYTFVTQFGDGYLGYTEASRRIVTQLGMPAQRVEVFGQSKNLQPLIHDVRSQTTAQRQALRRKIGLKEGPMACFVGRLTAYKNLPWLVEAVSRVEEAELVVAGPDDEELGPELERMARRSGLGRRLRLLGAVDAEGRRELLDDSDVLALPSRLASFNLRRTLGLCTAMCASSHAVLTWGSLYGVAILSGVGFTMSLFIDTLAFENLPADTVFDFDARLGILLGSLASGVMGYIVLDRTLPKAGSR